MTPLTVWVTEEMHELIKKECKLGGYTTDEFMLFGLAAGIHDGFGTRYADKLAKLIWATYRG